MTNEEAKKMLEAKLECLKNETSGINHDCNMRLCDGCSLNYEQGNMGEQKEALQMGAKALELISHLKRRPCEDYIKRADVLKYAQLIRDDEGIVHEMVHVDDIKDASSVTWSGWTPATQLPEPSTAVLLHVKYKSSGQWTYQLGMWNDNKQAWEDWRTPYQLEEEFEVIAWMELPEGYEEDKHER